MTEAVDIVTNDISLSDDEAGELFSSDENEKPVEENSGEISVLEVAVAVASDVLDKQAETNEMKVHNQNMQLYGKTFKTFLV